MNALCACVTLSLVANMAAVCIELDLKKATHVQCYNFVNICNGDCRTNTR